MSTATPDGHRKAAIEILAAGWISLGGEPTSGNRLEATSAFRRAWSAWSPARHFPLMQAEDFYIAVSKSTRRKSVAAGIEWGRTLDPVRLGGYTAFDDSELADIVADKHDFGDVTEDSVLELARNFLAPPPAR